MSGTTMIQNFLGSCHCGAVKFSVDTDLSSALQCNCSLCIRRSAIMLSGVEGTFKLLAGADKLSQYQFNSHVAEHYFCSVCGVYTHHKPRSNPSIFRVNAGCLAGVDPLKLRPGLNDGAAFSVFES